MTILTDFEIGLVISIISSFIIIITLAIYLKQVISESENHKSRTDIEDTTAAFLGFVQLCDKLISTLIYNEPIDIDEKSKVIDLDAKVEEILDKLLDALKLEILDELNTIVPQDRLRDMMRKKIEVQLQWYISDVLK